MNKKKWLYVALIIILAVPVLYLYFAFNGNPIAKQVSKYTLKNYLKETYPEDEFVIDKPFYNFKFGSYDFSVNKVGDSDQKEYEFNVVGIFGTHVHYDEIYYDNQDTGLIKKLEREAEKELEELLERIVPEIRTINVDLEILKGKYDPDITWDKQFRPEKPMSIWLEIDARSLTADDTFQATKKIQAAFDEGDYDYSHVTINANVPYQDYWIVKFVVGFDKGETINLKDIIEENKEHF